MFAQLESQLFTPKQQQILQSRAANASYDQLQQQYGFQNHTQIKNFLLRTSLGFTIKDAQTGGRYQLIGDVPAQIFLNECNLRCDANNCIKTSQAITVLEQTLADYLFYSYKRALNLGLPTIAASIINTIEETEFSQQWLHGFCKRNGLTILAPQSLEIIRNKYCHSNVIIQFFQMLQRTIHQVPYLLFNADETSYSAKRRHFVICPVGRRPLSETPVKPAHYTMVCCTNAAGDSFDPFIIIPFKSNLPPELLSFGLKHQVATSPSGWMTSKLFLAWTLNFVNQLSMYKLKNHIALRRYNATQAPTFLFLDGHKSRMNSEALEVLFKNNINVIIFPSHTTHVLQPFDVSLAAPLKNMIVKFNDNIPPI